MDANTILDSLRNIRSPFTAEQLRQINAAAVDRIRHEERVSAYKFGPGDRVRWTGRSGIPVTGTVIKKNQSTVSVRSDSGQSWRVGATLLERA